MTALVAAGAMEVATRPPSSAVAKPLNLPADTQHLVLIFHGTDCKDEPTLNSIGNTFRKEIAGRE